MQICALECHLARIWVSAAHKRMFDVQWGIQPSPEWFNHYFDLYYQWPHSNSYFWLERGVFSGLAIQKGGHLLELACGDGFNTKHFYSNKPKSVFACDFDEEALEHAKRYNNAPNISYSLHDIRTSMPHGKFDNIIWDAAIEHFTQDEIEAIMLNIKGKLNQHGILSGHTIVENPSGSKSLHQHEYEFKDMDDLKRFLTPYFKNVTVFQTLHPNRQNLYFWASDFSIPFSSNSPDCIHSIK